MGETIVFTSGKGAPDEEIGEGADHFDVEAFGAEYAYTVDGGSLGESRDGIEKKPSTITPKKPDSVNNIEEE